MYGVDFTWPGEANDPNVQRDCAVRSTTNILNNIFFNKWDLITTSLAAELPEEAGDKRERQVYVAETDVNGRLSIFKVNFSEILRIYGGFNFTIIIYNATIFLNYFTFDLICFSLLLYNHSEIKLFLFKV